MTFVRVVADRRHPNPLSPDEAIAQQTSLRSSASRKSSRNWKRRLPALFLALAAASVLSGCVYLRLLKFKHQLKDFDTFVEVEADDGLSLILRKPVLLDSDFVFLTDSEPTWIKTPSVTNREIEHWGWRFEKQLHKAGDQTFEIGFTTRFANSQLARIDFDPKLLNVIPKAFIVELFRSLGEARINKLRRSATATVTGDALPSVPLPSLREIEQNMGQPTERDSSDAGLLTWRYTFNFHNPETGEVAGQFRLDFMSRAGRETEPIVAFELTGKAS